MMLSELGCTGQAETSCFKALSAGKSSIAETMASASGFSKLIGSLIAGIFAVELLFFTCAGLPFNFDAICDAADGVPALGVSVDEDSSEGASAAGASSELAGAPTMNGERVKSTS